MATKGYRDVIGGAILIVIGLFTIVYTIETITITAALGMGPGVFPVALGTLLALFGAIIMIGAIIRGDQKLPRIDYRSFGSISLSILAFGLMIRPFGFVPAIAATIIIASRADSKLSLIGMAGVATAVGLISVLIFKVGLGLPLDAFNWPW